MNIAQRIIEAAQAAKGARVLRDGTIARLGEELEASRRRLASELEAAGVGDAWDVRAEIARKEVGATVGWSKATGETVYAQHDVEFRLRGVGLLGLRWRPESHDAAAGWAPTRATHLRLPTAERALEVHFEDPEAAARGVGAPAIACAA